MADARPDPAALAARIEERADELARSLVRTWRELVPDVALLDALPDVAVPEGALLPSEAGAAGHASAPRQAIDLYLAAVRGDGLGERERLRLRRQAARVADAGQPVATLVAAYGICGRHVLDALREDAGPHEQAALVEAASRLLIVNAEVTGDLTTAYHNERRDQSASRACARRHEHRALVRDLLIGLPPTQTATALIEEFRLDEGAVVLAVTFTEGADPSGSEWAMATTQRAVDEYLGREVPMLLDADGGYALVPHALLPAPQGPALDEIAAQVARDVPSARLAAASAHSPGEIARAARTAGEVLRLAGRLGHPPGAYRLTDVLVEYHLTRRDESAALLEGLLAPLADRPELLETVRVYLEENYDRRRTARRLSLHPNTVDNRLARTTELTGLDPSTPRGVTLLMTALALRDLG